MRKKWVILRNINYLVESKPAKYVSRVVSEYFQVQWSHLEQNIGKVSSVFAKEILNGEDNQKHSISTKLIV